MNDYISLAMSQDPIVYAAGAGAFAAVSAFALLRVLRAVRRRSSGQLLGQSPQDEKAVSAINRADFEQEFLQLRAEFESTLFQMRTEQLETCDQLERKIDELRTQIQHLKKAASVSDAVLQAKLGADYRDLEKFDGVSADEAKTLSMINSSKAG